MVNREQIIQNTLERKVITIIRGMEGDVCLRIAEAVIKGGLNMVEVTFNQSKPETFETTCRAIAGIKQEFGGEVLVGAGTVISPKLVEMAAEAGAGYIISPDTSVEVIKRTRELGMVSMPGAMTPTDIMTAWNAGADFVKLFPAGDLGLGYFKSVRAPLSHIPLLAVGAIGENNIRDFMKAGAKAFGIGSNIVKKDWVANGEFDKIAELARRYKELVQED